MPVIIGPPVSATIARLSHAPNSTITLMRCSGPQPSRDTTQPIAAIRISSALSDIVGGGDCNTPARRVTSRGVTGRGHQSGSPVGVTDRGHRLGFHRSGSPVGVTGRARRMGCHRSGCHRSGSPAGVYQYCVFSTGVCVF